MSRPPVRPNTTAPVNYRVNVVRFSVVREPDASPRAMCSAPDAAVAVARAFIPDDAREHFLILLLDSQNRLVCVHEASVGTLSSSLVSPREVFGPALRVLGVSSVILAHNHPSGDPTPSPSDVRLTRQLVEAGRVVDIRVHDHLVLGTGTEQYVSLAERGLMQTT